MIRRIERLESGNTALREQTRGEAGRAALRNGNRSAYLAKTIRVGVTYPASGNTFGLVFFDRLFTPAEGPQTVTDSPRDDEAQAVGRTLDGRWLAEGTVVLAIPAPAPPGSPGGGRWHIMPLTPEADDGIDFVNASGEIIPPHAAMHVPSSVVVGSVEYLQAYKPGAEFDIEWLINGADYVPIGAASKGFWRKEASGPVLVSEEFLPITHIGWGPVPDSWALEPSRSGFDCLSTDTAEIDTDVFVANFTQREVTRVYGKLYEDLDMTQYPAGDASAEFEIWFRDTDNKMKVAGWGKISVFAPFFNKNDKAKKGTFGVADWYSDHWEGDFACDVDDKDTAQASPGAFTDQATFIFQGQDASDSTDQMYYQAGATGVGMGKL